LLGRLDPDDRIREAMLERDQWFEGAPGIHEPQHSLISIVDVLPEYDDPETRVQLGALQQELLLLNRNTGTLKWVLNRALTTD